MDKLNGNTLSNYPFHSARKISDLLYYEEPILTHLRQGKVNVLQYLIDFDDHHTRYLAFQLDDYELFKLVSGNESILNSIRHSSEDFTFIYVIDFSSVENVIVNTVLLTLEELDETYLPKADSFIDSQVVKSKYASIISAYSETFYIERLRSEAYFLKFEPVHRKFDSSLGIIELSKLLSLVTTSFKNFTKVDFFKFFEDKISDQNRLNRMYNSLKDFLDSRAVEFRFGSFEVGIAIDRTMKQGKASSPDIQNWLNTVEEKYKAEVLEVDYSDEEQVDRIIQQNHYSEAEIESIYKPIMKISQDSDYKFEYKGSQKSSYKEIVVKNHNVIEKLSPKPLKKVMEEEPLPSEIEYINVVIPKPVGKEINAKIKLENTLFSSITSTQLTNENFSKEGFDIPFEINIIVELSSANGLAVLSTVYDGEKFEEQGDGGNFAALTRTLIKRIAEYIFERDNLQGYSSLVDDTPF